MSDVSPSESARQQACCVPIASRKVWGVKQIPNFGIACLESFQETADGDWRSAGRPDPGLLIGWSWGQPNPSSANRPIPKTRSFRDRGVGDTVRLACQAAREPSCLGSPHPSLDSSTLAHKIESRAGFGTLRTLWRLRFRTSVPVLA